MFSAAMLALSEILTPPFRAVLWKSLGWTIAALAVLGVALQALLLHLATWPDHPWLHATVVILGGVGLVVGLIFLIAPVTSLVASFYGDEIAGLIERQHYPQDPPGRDMSVAAGAGAAIGFGLTVLVVNLICLLLLLVPGINLVAFFIGNGYLLGREFFENAAARFRPIEAARALRREHKVTVFMAGLVIALFLAIPIVNLLTPLFATAFMTHLHKRLTGSRPISV
jgi:CysZ protein